MDGVRLIHEKGYSLEKAPRNLGIEYSASVVVEIITNQTKMADQISGAVEAAGYKKNSKACKLFYQ